ncbi:tryptophan halogenase family protein [Kordiimonas marina]|uniref:tryptophan halogenase family protein n=1 Tax=Kordiimonas marina TaxID=2872312 RepID=UPI001FF54B80|nr:tryptophan halogenase family protein [Kordiimonas marina]MCJ9428809.1 tryptophan 7-halogenase [Kordiimonas marina]
MTDNRIKDVVIVGGGTAGWMAASALSYAMPGLLNIRLIESDAIGTVGVGEATIPQIRLFNRLVELDEDEFLKATHGTFKLGIQFQNWNKLGDCYMHAFGSIGRGLGMLEFENYWLKARAEGVAGSLWDYSLNDTAALAGKMARFDTIPGTNMQGISYAFHFDATLYARFLRKRAEAKGVTRTEGKIVDVTLRGSDGFIESVTLENGTEIGGDLFIDCSGFRGLLIEDALKTGYDDWTHWLPCDRAIAVPSENVSAPRPYTQSIAHTAGWQWRIPLQHRTGNGHVFCSDYMSEDEATAILLSNLEGKPLADPRVLKFTTGKRRKFWNKNCIALGLSSGFMEPLESTSIHLIQSGLSRLLSLFPDKSFAQAEIDEYNRQADFEFERIRDFLILHYHANERTDSDFWTRCREMDIPETLQHKIDLFRSTGRIFREHEELFTELGWFQVMIGQGITPEAYHPMADMLTRDQLKGFMGDLKTIVDRTVAQLPSQEDFIRAHCAIARQ